MKKRSSADSWMETPSSVVSHAIENKKARTAADQLAEFLNAVAGTIAVDQKSMSKNSDGFCFIAKNNKTKKFHGHAGMNIGDNRVAVTFQQPTISGCEAYIHAWVNHTITSFRGR